jgi:hypothetical protein
MVSAWIVFASELNPPTPPLLKHARVGGGSDGDCPPRGNENFRGPQSGSRDVEERLATQFAPGTAEQKLIGALQEQGFKLIAPCDNDPQIHRAIFRQEGGSFLGPFPVFANIAWKIDDLGNVVWTKAFIAYSGP